MKLLTHEALPEAVRDFLKAASPEPVGERFPEVMLEWRDESLWLLDGRLKQSPVRVDFIADYKDLRIGKDDLLGKAVGLRRGLRHVVDITAGWGHDTLRLLKLGCEVVAIERSPVIYALLMDGLRRAEQNPQWLNLTAPRLKLIHGEAKEVLAGLPAEWREVIYMDPMFPERKKGALAKGEMQLLQTLLGPDDDMALTWETAWHYSARRLVYKSPRLTPAFAHKPDLSFEGRAVRYDVWLRTE